MSAQKDTVQHFSRKICSQDGDRVCKGMYGVVRLFTKDTYILHGVAPAPSSWCSPSRSCGLSFGRLVTFLSWYNRVVVGFDGEKLSAQVHGTP